MAYLPPSLSQRRALTDVGGTPVGGASTLGGSGVAAAPVGGGLAPGAPASTTPAGGRYSALRGFLDANQPAVDAAATAVAAPIEDRAEEAVSLAGESATLPENKGGAEKAASASEAKDDALSRIAAASQGVIGDLPAADVSQGAQAADEFLYSRSAPIRDLQKWDPVLRALNPTYGAPYCEPAPPPPPPPKVFNPATYGVVKAKQIQDAAIDAGNRAAGAVGRAADTVGRVVQAIDPSKWW